MFYPWHHNHCQRPSHVDLISFRLVAEDLGLDRSWLPGIAKPDSIEKWPNQATILKIKTFQLVLSHVV